MERTLEFSKSEWRELFKLLQIDGPCKQWLSAGFFFLFICKVMYPFTCFSTCVMPSRPLTASQPHTPRSYVPIIQLISLPPTFSVPWTRCDNQFMTVPRQVIQYGKSREIQSLLWRVDYSGLLRSLRDRDIHTIIANSSVLLNVLKQVLVLY